MEDGLRANTTCSSSKDRPRRYSEDGKRTSEGAAGQSSTQAPDSPGRKELIRHISANFPALAFHAFGRLPDGIGDVEIRRLSTDIEEIAHASTSDIKDPAARKQAYYKEASKLLLETVLEHCPPDADPTACVALPQPQLEPLSALRPHVARPPMDPRFNATSPFADHTEEPNTPPARFAPPLSVLNEDAVPLVEGSSVRSNSRPVLARVGSLTMGSQQQSTSASVDYISARAASMCYGRNSSVMGSDSTSVSSGRMQSIRRQMSLTLRQDSNLQPLSLSSLGRQTNVWGWLEAADPSMSNVLLEGAGIAIGRSREAFEARRHALSVATSEAGAIQDPSPTRRLAEVSAKALGFVEIADGRVSRLHCMIRADAIVRLPLISRLTQPAMLEDHSVNGTFLNGERLAKGERRPLADGDQLSVVLSLSPMVERTYIFRLGDPRQKMDLAGMGWADTSSSATCAVALGTADEKNSPRGDQQLLRTLSSRKGLKRMATSRYTTADSSEPGDMMCQICLGPLRACLALQPCGHNFCAACLSHHFASLLQSGQALTCPLRCAAPERVVANQIMRTLVLKHFPKHRTRSVKPPEVPKVDAKQNGTASSRRQSLDSRGISMTSEALSLEEITWQTFDRARFERDKSAAAASREPSNGLTEPVEGGAPWDEEADTDADVSDREDEDRGEEDSDEGALTEMSSLCPLWDNMLPLDAASLKTKQVEYALKDLQLDDLDKLMAALEVLARLAWSDDEVRMAIARGAGIDAVVGLMRKWVGEPGLLCNACLCLMSLVRGDGPACEANQWQVAKAGGVEAVVGCMTAFPGNALVQLSSLLCIIPLALDNPSLQAHVATLSLPAVVAALRAHAQHADVQAKGLVVLGVLGQGEEAVHDAIRQQQLAVGVVSRILAAVREWGAQNEEVLWAVLFSLAVLVRDGANPFHPAIRAVAAAGIPPLLTAALDTYKEEAGDQADEMIVTAGDYLLKTLAPAAAQVTRERYGIAGLAMAPVVAASAFWAWRSVSR